jgi:ParB-like chromosome segregation protein Spo0J
MRHVPRMVHLDQVKFDSANARVHSKQQIRRIASSIKALGFAVPVLINEQGVLLAGHGRLAAAKLMGLKTIPAISVEGLSPAQQRALRLADNRLAEQAGWDREKLSVELVELSAEGMDIEITGFLPTEIDQLTADFEERPEDPSDTTKLNGPPSLRSPGAVICGAWGNTVYCAAMPAIEPVSRS